jgi:hypothetical protein
MITRRKFLAGCAISGTAVGAGFLEAGRLREKFLCGGCSARYFSEDWLGLGYEKYYHSLFADGRSAQLS